MAFPGAITRPSCSCFYHLWCSCFEIVSQAHLTTEFNDETCEVDVGRPTKLRGLVVPGKGMVVVVPALPQSKEGHKEILWCIDALFIWFAPYPVCQWVDRPGEMIEKEHAHKYCNHNGVEEMFPPAQAWYHCWNYNGHQESQGRIMLFLPHYQVISFQICHVQAFCFGDIFWVLLIHHPTDVRVKESPMGIVWVSIRLTVFVMDTMVCNPIIKVTLQRKGVEENKHSPQRKSCFKGAVWPETVSSHRHSKSGQDTKHGAEGKGLPLCRKHCQVHSIWKAQV